LLKIAVKGEAEPSRSRLPVTGVHCGLCTGKLVKVCDDSPVQRAGYTAQTDGNESLWAPRENPDGGINDKRVTNYVIDKVTNYVTDKVTNYMTK
jgi:hypothetical protein